MCAGAGADDRLAGLAVCEEDRGRDGEHAVSGGDDRVLVDVQLCEFDPARVLLGEVCEDGLDGLARAAPGGPEVDDHGSVGLQDLGVERFVGDLAHRARLPGAGHVQCLAPAASGSATAAGFRSASLALRA
jgi:hypothetical protein